MNQYFDLGALRPLYYFMAVATVLGLLFAFIGPDPSGGFGTALVQWQLQSWLPLGLMIASHIVLHRIRRFATGNAWLKLLVSGFIGALLFSPLALLVDIVLSQQPMPGGRSGWFAQWSDEAAGVMPPVLVAWLAINAPWISGWRIDKATRDTALPADSGEAMPQIDAEPAVLQTRPTGLLNLLAGSNPQDIRMIKSDLHYLAVNTVNGNAMVLYNLKDAIADLDGIDGFQPHRSYWVNRRYVSRLTKTGRQAHLILDDDTSVPVSRARLAAVASALKPEG